MVFIVSPLKYRVLLVNPKINDAHFLRILHNIHANIRGDGNCISWTVKCPSSTLLLLKYGDILFISIFFNGDVQNLIFKIETL